MGETVLIGVVSKCFDTSFLKNIQFETENKSLIQRKIVTQWSQLESFNIGESSA